MAGTKITDDRLGTWAVNQVTVLPSSYTDGSDASIDLKTASKTYTFAKPCRRIYIQTTATMTDKIYVRWGTGQSDTDVSASNYDNYIGTDQYWESPRGVAFTQVSLYVASNQDFYTDFVVKGWL